MPFPPNVTMTFVAYKPTDTGCEMEFVCSEPGEEAFSNWKIHITDAEWQAATTGPQRLALVTGKLNRKYRATVFKNTLDPLIGTGIVI